MPNQQAQLNKAKASIKQFGSMTASQESKPTETDAIVQKITDSIMKAVDKTLDKFVDDGSKQEDGKPVVNASKVLTGSPDPEQYFAGNHDSKPQSGAPKADDYF